MKINSTDFCFKYDCLLTKTHASTQTRGSLQKWDQKAVPILKGNLLYIHNYKVTSKSPSMKD